MEVAMKYKNPVIPGFHPDPSVCRKGSDYYLVTSSFEYFPGVPIFHSKDLVHWRQIGYCLTRDSQLPLEGAKCSSGIWAPTIRYHDGLFYMITTNMHTGYNFYVTAEDPAGEWSDPIYVDKGAFDPSLFFDDDGKVYYTRRDWNFQGTGQAEIDIRTGELTTPFTCIAKGFCSPDQEGPHLYKIKGYYYLMAAEGGTRYGHMITIARSRSPWGPFEPCPHNPILTHRHISSSYIRHTGHGELFEAHDGSWWMVCLGTRHHIYEDASILGRETFLMPVTWTEDGWPVVNGDGTVPLEFEIEGIPPHPWLLPPVRDDFDSEKLNLCWNFLRNPSEDSWSLTERRGFLRLKGLASTLSDTDAKAFIGRRQQHFNFSAQVLLDFEPMHDGEEAGLCVMCRDTYHYEIAVTRQDGHKKIILRKRVEDITVVTYEEAIPQGSVILRIEGSPHEYRFLYACNDGDFEMAGSGATKLLSGELAEIWTGNYIGMYATGNGRKSSVPADVDWFDYAPAEE